jgi:hypothetical protein
MLNLEDYELLLQYDLECCFGMLKRDNINHRYKLPTDERLDDVQLR